MDQLRLQRLEAEFKAAEKARRERAVHRQEMAIKDAFMQVRHSEHAVLHGLHVKSHAIITRSCWKLCPATLILQPC